ncbi:polysaccharide biosynthesis protein [Paenibacillus larvae]|nr:polysaccharide biosynthesis protein [Paenibacillus larvae]MDT2274901.1 polysaccharide biosynthesis protein [Paenibacillus larvae]
MYTCAADIAALIGVPAASNAIRSISFALLLVPSLSVMRGYFQGYQNMVPTAVSQVIEQVVRVITLVALLLYFLHAGFSDEWIAAGATFGSVTGAVGGLVAVCWFWRGQKKIFSTEWNRKGNLESNRESIWKLIKQITAYAIPICLGAIVMPILNLVDTFTIPRVLQLEGASISEAVRVFGLYNRGLPLVQAVVMIASAMTAVLVPAIAEARVRGRVDQVQSRTEFSVRLTWIIGLAASVGLAALSVPINIMLFRNSEASLTMAILAFTAVFSMMNVVTSSLLQGAGALYAPALHLLAATLIKVAGNLWLMLRYGINGAAAAAVLAYAAAAGLNIVQLKRCTGAAFALRDFAARPIAAVAAMTASLPLWVYGSIALCTLLPMKERVIYTVAALVGVLGGTAVYALALFRFRVLTRSDLHSVPALEKKLAPILAKLNLLPEERRP